MENCPKLASTSTANSKKCTYEDIRCKCNNPTVSSKAVFRVDVFAEETSVHSIGTCASMAAGILFVLMNTINNGRFVSLKRFDVSGR